MAARARRLTLTRRALLGAGATAAALSGCGEEARRPPRTTRIRYDDQHGSQFVDLRVPRGDPRATVVLLHGGYWLPPYGLDLMEPLARRLTRLGFATWNVEYRRTTAGGGYPDTLVDVAHAVDRLAQEDLAHRVVLLGHSAGGHLAVWAASRTDETPGGPPTVRPAAAVSLSGVLDLTRAAQAPGSSAPVTAFMGGLPAQVPDRYALADPSRLVPASCPVHAVHAEDDLTVPEIQSTAYVARDRAAGGTASYHPVPGDHFSLVDPAASAFGTVRALVEQGAD